MIPSNFGVILETLVPHFNGDRTAALKATDALMEKLPRPEGHCLCACNRAWIPCPDGKPQDSKGHGWDDCTR